MTKRKSSPMVLALGLLLSSSFAWGQNEQVTDTISKELEEIEVFGVRKAQPKKMDFLTRMPLRPEEQVQSISTISSKLIEQQSAGTLSDAVRNVVGVGTFSTYGGRSESLTARGYRGLPLLKNGVRMNSDMKGIGSIVDMQGVESIQIVKGSAAITQGIGNDIASAGGTVNVATKTPRFNNSGVVSLRSGSWGLFRPTVDLERELIDDVVSIRLNGALERADSYRKHVTKDRYYFNPSLAWMVNSDTRLILEMDYLHDSRTPDRGTVNFGKTWGDNEVYEMPHDKFLGFESDRTFTTQMTATARLEHRFTQKLSLRAVAATSRLEIDEVTSSIGHVTDKVSPISNSYSLFNRSLGRSARDDRNTTIQIDLVGQDIFTGKIKHTFQVGMDYNATALTTQTAGKKGVKVDQVDVAGTFTNTLPAKQAVPVLGPEVNTAAYSYGLVAQDLITFNKYLKAMLGVRYSLGTTPAASNSAKAFMGDAFNPMLGLIVTPIKGLNVFGSYTTTTNTANARKITPEGESLGNGTTDQFEAGVKGSWFGDRFRLNVTYFNVTNKNISYGVYDQLEDGSWVATPYSRQAGDINRQGIEVEATGRPTERLDVILGYAYLDAKYRNTKAYVEGSAPMNTPKHTANGWLYYSFPFGLRTGVGAYYVGERPVTDHSLVFTHGYTDPGVKPFMMDGYFTLNASIGYVYKQWGLNVAFNNITDSYGWNSYARGGFMNPIDPRNFTATLSYTL